MKKLLSIVVLAIAALCNQPIQAHDTWVEAGALRVPLGEYVYVDLRLGNHGNNHRDFKLASKITLAPCTLSVTTPSGEAQDLKPLLIDTGYAEKEGYWTARYVTREAGVHEVLHQLDTLHGTTRAIKSSKTYFVVEGNGPIEKSASKPSQPAAGQERIGPRALGLELVLESPVEQLAAQSTVRLRLLRDGKPLSGTTVSFIPRGVTLSAGEDATYERKTDAEGRVEFTPAEGNVILAVAHHVAADEQEEGYDKTHYGATLVLPVPQRSLSPR